MRRIAEKPDLMNTIAVKVWTQAEISSSLEPANLIFCISARKLPRKIEILIVQVEFGKIISIER